MLQRLREKRRDEGGFTLIELLVVILIIAILAAIAIPVFLRQREKGYVAQTQSALKNAATAMESAAVPLGGNYSTIDTLVELEAEGFKKAAAVTVTIPAATLTSTSYCIQATHSGLPAADVYSYKSANGEPKKEACA
jgi:type IV pilus assembly protein PilA